MKRPKLSLAVVTYNRAEMLRQCLTSLQTVTIADCEILVVDDASPDHTPEVVHEFAALDPRIRYLRNDTNKGQLNCAYALEQASGDYLCYVCDDDSIRPRNFERKLAILEANPHIGMVYSRWYHTDQDNRTLIVPAWPGHLDYSYIGGRNEFMDLLPGNHIHMLSMVFRRTLLERYGGFDLGVGWALTDWDLVLRYSRHMQTAYINEPMVIVRVHSQSLTGTIGVNGGFVTGQLLVWRKWLIDNPELIVIGERVWQGMHNSFASTVANSFRDDTAQQQSYLRQFEDLRREYTARAAAHFAEGTRFIAPAFGFPTNSKRTHFVEPAVIWSGPVQDISSMGSDLLTLARASSAAGLTTRVEDVHWGQPRMLLSDNERDCLRPSRWTPMPPGAAVLHVRSGLPPYLASVRTEWQPIIRTSFWSQSLPEGWLDHCKPAKTLLLPSSFSFQAFLDAGIPERQLRILPQCIEPARFGPAIPPIPTAGNQAFTFLSVLEWSRRKGWDALVKAWAQEFRPGEAVVLVLSVHSVDGKSVQEIGAEIQQTLTETVGSVQVAPIRVQYVWPNDPALPDLYGAAQAYVQPSRGEAWGRHILQAMATGLPTIATAWGGHQDFTDADNSYRLQYAIRPVPADIAVAHSLSHGIWAEPSVEHLRSLMREVFSNRSQAAARGAKARADIIERCSPKAIGTQIRQLCEEFATQRIACA